MDTDNKFKQENKEILDLVNSGQWQVVKRLLNKEIDDIQSVMNVQDSEPEKVYLDILIRKNLIDTIRTFIKRTEGQAHQYEENELSAGEKGIGHILREE